MSQAHEFNVLNSTLFIVESVIFLSYILPCIVACIPDKQHPTKLFNTVGYSINNWNQWPLGQYTAKSGKRGGVGDVYQKGCSIVSPFSSVIHYCSRILVIYD